MAQNDSKAPSDRAFGSSPWLREMMAQNDSKAPSDRAFGSIPSYANRHAANVDEVD